MHSDLIKYENGEAVYEPMEYEPGDILEAAHMNRVEAYLEDIYGILKARPQI